MSKRDAGNIYADERKRLLRQMAPGDRRTLLALRDAAIALDSHVTHALRDMGARTPYLDTVHSFAALYIDELGELLGL